VKTTTVKEGTVMFVGATIRVSRTNDAGFITVTITPFPGYRGANRKDPVEVNIKIEPSESKTGRKLNTVSDLLDLLAEAAS
jgi:hypothetical protein